MSSVSRKKEPLAITGMGMKFPGGANSKESFWNLLCRGDDAITEIPADRWNISRFYHPELGVSNRTYSKWGGFVRDYEEFDPAFFSISAAEAVDMDPQQRVLLEVAWHALEDAGEVVDRKQHEAIGVFIGACANEYKNVHASIAEPLNATPYTATGGAGSIISNRISHALHLSGPSITFDTACSSSLVALHYGCLSLWSGECDRALVGGVNYITDPLVWIAFCNMGVLSKTGRCRAFDAAADGFVRAEGAGIVMLKPLSRALADGDRIYACIRETGCNQDGRTPAIAMPDRAAQEQLIKQTLESAGLQPENIDYVEAHGTGTPIGDPIEANAIGNVLGRRRATAQKLLMGSVKTNIGHLEGGAGIAGLIKSALVLWHRQVPPNLHFQHANPAIPLAELNLQIPTELTPLAASTGKDQLFSCINSFGFGGTNAHAILESHTAPDPVVTAQATTSILTLSAQSEQALQDSVTALLEVLPDHAEQLHAVAVSSVLHRARLQHQLHIRASAPEITRQALRDWQAGNPTADAIFTSDRKPKQTGIVFVFNGQGSQWCDMGRELMNDHPQSRALIETIRDEIRLLGGFDLIEELERPATTSRINRTEIAQPAIFAVQVALAHWWQEHGVHPAAIIGHSVGEVAAAYASGVLTLKQAVQVIYHRGNAMQHAGGGKMLAVGIDADEARKLIQPYGSRLALAAVNSPTSVSISGEPEALEELAQVFEAREVFCREVPVEYAFHSAQMDPVQKPLQAALEGLNAVIPTIPLYSSVTGQKVTTEIWNAEYWWKNVRETVLFSDAILQLLKDGYTGFLEIGSHPALRPSITQCARAAECSNAVITYSQHKKEPSSDSLFQALATLDGSGYLIDRQSWVHGTAFKTELPRYPFDHEPLEVIPESWGPSRLDPQSHPYLVTSMHDIHPAWYFQPSPKLYPYFSDHVFDDIVLIPAAAFVEMGLAIGHGTQEAPRLVLEDLNLKQLLRIPEGRTPPAIRISLQEPFGRLQVHSCVGSDFKDWTLHAEGELRVPTRAPQFDLHAFQAARERCHQPVDVAATYSLLAECGLHFGPTFRTVQEMYSGNMEAFAIVRLSESTAQDPWQPHYYLHPALLDGVFQSQMASIPAGEASFDAAYLPSSIRRLRFERAAGTELQVHIRLIRMDRQEIVADFTLVNPRGELVAQIEGFKCTRLNVSNRLNPYGTIANSYQTNWHLTPPSWPADISQPASFFPPLTDILNSVRERRERREQVLTRASAESERLALERIARCYVNKAMLELGFNPTPGLQFSEAEIQKMTAVVPQHNRQLRQYLFHLSEAGVLQPLSPTSWKVVQSLSDDGLDAAYEDVMAHHPVLISTLNLITAVGDVQAQALRGEKHLSEVLSNSENNDLLERLYSNSTTSLLIQDVVADAVRQLSASLPVGRTLRILEIGGGTGATTLSYLPMLPPGRYELIFTDVCEAFLNKAEQRFCHHPEIRFRRLDISQPPSEQDFDGGYDLIIAANVLHATPELVPAVKHMHSLLRGGGVSLTVECIRQHLISMDLLFGLIPGWWGYHDSDFRGDYPNPDLTGWTSLFKSTGFEECHLVTSNTQPEYSDCGVFLLRATDQGEETATRKEASGHWLVIPDDTLQLSGAVAAELRCRGMTSEVVDVGNEQQGWDHLFRLANAKDCRGILYLRESDAWDWSDQRTAQELDDALQTALYDPIDLIKTLAEQEWDSIPLLVFVTRGALPVLPDEVPRALPSLLQSMLRVADNEVRQLALPLLDLSANPTSSELRLLVDELSDLDAADVRAENQIAFRGEGRYVPRLELVPPHAPKPEQPVLLHDTPCRITSSQFGMLDRLEVETTELTDPEANEVEVCIHAVGLNFRDVMKALNIYPTTIGDARLLGDEFCGDVVQVGSGVTRFQPGDRVIGMSMGSFRSSWTGHQNALCPLPESMTYCEGATLLTAYSTAYHALYEVGRIQEGERVLLHSATGGVGLAAVRLAQHAGAEVFATAGSVMKRTLLQRMGVKHVFDSRSLEFADDIMRVTAGEGVDLVLNSLAGAAIPKSLDCLRQGGRFMEIGKRDIYGNSKIGLRPFKNGLTFTAIDLAMGIGDKSPQQTDRIRRIGELLEQQVIRPLPHTIFPFSQPAHAFRYMSQGRHVGKIVLSLTEERGRPRPRFNSDLIQFSKQRSALITGGTKGMGLAMARWIVRQGARHLMLISRSGLEPENQPLQEFIQEAQAAGAQVEVRAVDVTDAAALEKALKALRQTMPALGTVIHSAFVMADILFTQMTRKEWETSLHIKAFGAWNLHRLTLEDELEHFMVFSSVSSLLGSPGQANYVAANTFLEDLVRYRQSRGLSGMSVNLDKVNDIGSVARDEALETSLTRMGWVGLSSEQATQSINAMLMNGRSSGAAIRTDISAVIAKRPLFNMQNRFSLLPKSETSEDSGSQGQQLRQRIATAPASERLEPAVEYLTAQVARILRTPRSSLSPNLPLAGQGMDSLMAVELVGILESQLSLSIPTGKISTAPSINSLAAVIVEVLTGEKFIQAPFANSSATQEEGSSPGKYPGFAAEESPDQDLQRLKEYQQQLDLSYQPPTQREHIFLTGANGLLGTYLLREWLQNTSLHVTCLVRAKTTTEARKRVRDAWQRYQLDVDLLDQQSSRWQVVCGDLSALNLGLRPDEFQRLSEVVDTIFHSGALVDHVAAYHSLRSANVIGTLECLRLAATGIPKRFHFASSVAVYDRKPNEKTEQQPPDPLSDILAGYGQTKAVSEHLLDQSRDQGLQCTIHRIGPVIGDSVSGISAQHDILWILLKISARMGASASNNSPMGLIPVDLASRIMTAALMSEKLRHRILVANPEFISFDSMVSALREQGISIKSVSMVEWLAKAKQDRNFDEIKAYALFRPEVVRDMINGFQFPHIHLEMVAELLQEANITVEPMTPDKLELYARYLIRTELQDLVSAKEKASSRHKTSRTAASPGSDA